MLASVGERPAQLIKLKLQIFFFRAELSSAELKSFFGADISSLELNFGRAELLGAPGSSALKKNLELSSKKKFGAELQGAELGWS